MPDTPAQRHGILLERLLGSNQWERAAGVARDWLAEDPASVPAHRAMAQALVNLERYDAVPGHVARVLAGNPRDGFAHRLASIACFATKDFAGADDHIQQAIALQPQMAMHWYHLAWMRYRHGALEAAARYGQRALELAPENADTINLLALCQRLDAKTRLERYEHALALDPENAMVHNNVGSYYLHAGRDPRRALESFRQSLRLDPTNRVAQNNLFAALRRSDPLYRVLAFPRDCLGWLQAGRAVNRRRQLLFLLVFILAVIHSWASLALYGLWLLVGWPLLRGYEFLTLGDVRARAGIPGARRGGLGGFWRWPFAARFGLCFLALAVFWVRAAWLLRDVPSKHIVALLAGFALLTIFCQLVWNGVRDNHRRFRNWRAERRFRRQARRAGRAVPGLDDAFSSLPKPR